MNELSSFHDGDMSEPKIVTDNLPYSINNQGSKQPLRKKTVSPSAIHYGGLKEYDVHNLYGKGSYTCTYITVLYTTCRVWYLRMSGSLSAPPPPLHPGIA